MMPPSNPGDVCPSTCGPFLGVIWKHISAGDVVARLGVLQAHIGATVTTAALFLDNHEQPMLFPSPAARANAAASSPRN